MTNRFTDQQVRDWSVRHGLDSYGESDMRQAMEDAASLPKLSIQDRIREAMGENSSMGYHDLMQAVFPHALYPRAYRYKVDGGPPGCAMAFNAAIRKMGWWNNYNHGNKRIYRSTK